MINWNEKLLSLFGDYVSSNADTSWENIKSRHAVGSAVEGKVIARAHFGIWVDLELGFPALLETIVIDGMTPEKYKLDEYLAVGEVVKAKISHYVDARHQIYLKQKEWPSSFRFIKGNCSPTRP